MITAVEIKNFKSWSDKKINLNPQGITILAGPNNGGKTTLLQALAVWNFCKIVITHTKGKQYFYGKSGNSIPVSLPDFYPITIPEFEYLWPNLTPKGKFSLKITVHWRLAPSADHPEAPEERHLGFSLNQTLKTLSIKVAGSNVKEDERIPNIALLTPFAGIEANEEPMTKTLRSRLIGKGLSGAVLRNEIKELADTNQEKRAVLKAGKAKISDKNLKVLRETDPFEILQALLTQMFSIRLTVEPYIESYHSYLKVNYQKGEIKKSRFQPHPNFKKREIISQGSGFLQMLSVMTYALSPNFDVLMLDEPDAHLHTTMQVELLRQLEEHIGKLRKQILIATHSTEIIRTRKLEDIFEVSRKGYRYLSDDSQRVALLANLGSTYCPRLDKLKQSNKLLLIENDSDVIKLKKWATTLGISWPEDIVCWQMADQHKERRQFHKYLETELTGDGAILKTMSLNDRDYLDPSQAAPDLKDRSYPDKIAARSHFLARRWQRHEIESYMMHPAPIGRMAAAKRKVSDLEGIAQIEKQVQSYLESHFGMCFDEGFTSANREDKFNKNYDLPGHETMKAIGKHFHINNENIYKEMRSEEIFEDVKNLLNEISTFFA